MPATPETYNKIRQAAECAMPAVGAIKWGPAFAEPTLLTLWQKIAPPTVAHFEKTEPLLANAWDSLNTECRNYKRLKAPKKEQAAETFAIHAFFMGRFDAFLDLKDDPKHREFFLQIRDDLQAVARYLQDHVLKRTTQISDKYNDFLNRTQDRPKNPQPRPAPLRAQSGQRSRRTHW